MRTYTRSSAFCFLSLYVVIVFHTPDELVLEIHTAMRKVFADRPEVVSAVLLDELFDFGAWLDAQGVHLHNAWVSRDGVDGPHSLCYKMREDLIAGELENVPVSRQHIHRTLNTLFALSN